MIMQMEEKSDSSYGLVKGIVPPPQKKKKKLAVHLLTHRLFQDVGDYFSIAEQQIIFLAETVALV